MHKECQKFKFKFSPVPPRAIANDGEVPMQLAITYLPFGQANYFIQSDVINLFQNHQHIRFSKKPIENSHKHIQTFLMLYEVISHKSTSTHAFRMCLFPHSLKDGTQEWPRSLSPRSIFS